MTASRPEEAQISGMKHKFGKLKKLAFMVGTTCLTEPTGEPSHPPAELVSDLKEGSTT